MPRRPPHRRAVSQVGGRIHPQGEPEVAARLAAAWRAAEGDGREFTHGFHPWPARLHPRVARSLLLAFSAKGQAVLDPFAGSGTVVTEALAQGRRGLGGDLHPLAVRIARVRTLVLPRDRRIDLERSAAALAGRALRHGEDVEVPERLRDLFTRPTWRELSALAGGIARMREPLARFVLEQVLSSLLIRVSRRTAETDPRRGRGVPAGAAARLFADRTAELCAGLRELEQAARGTPQAAVWRHDARRMPLRTGSVDLVLTSPPYLGTYDYIELQDVRAALLGVDLAGMAAAEIGTRRRAEATPAEEERRYVDDLRQVLAEVTRVLRPPGWALIVLGDSSVRDRAMDAERLLRSAAAGCGLRVRAIAAQERPQTVASTRSAFGRAGRREHIVALSR